MFHSPKVVASFLLVCAIGSSSVFADDKYAATIQPFLARHCLKCHGPKKAEGDLRLDDLSARPGEDLERWLAVRDQLRDGLMPPDKEPRPDGAELRTVVAWATARSHAQAARLPNQGNLVPHELLFGKPEDAERPGDERDRATAARVWRLSPDGYLGFLQDATRRRLPGIVQPFSLIPERGLKDFSGLYAIDEPSTEILLRNAATAVESQTAHEMRDGVPRGKNDTVGEFVKLMDPKLEPTRDQLTKAIQTQFRLAIGRPGGDEDVERLLKLYERCVAPDDRPGALKMVLQAVLLRADAMYRLELGDVGPDGRPRRLAPLELARAVSLALGDRRDGPLQQAAEKEALVEPEQVAAHVRRMLDDPKLDKPRLLRFFREYFEYHRALDVFKEKPKQFKHEASVLVADTDRLVKHLLAEDQDVLRRLLTTRLSFVNAVAKQNKQTRQDELHRAVQPDAPNKNRPTEIFAPEHVYGLNDWPNVQPTELPADTRIGVLMQPSWLVAFSTNFDNDPVRRGRWIRERLLGGTVPDLPIGVAAQVPDEKHRTFRDRLTVTRDARCWKCHQRMDELGLPLEQFDHYGRFRTTEQTLDVEATEKNVDKKGAPLGPVHRESPLDTTGRIADSGDPALDGPVADPRELLLRLADSPRVRQVFVRHAFRYFVGRNETLSDGATLRRADRAYVESGGSFKALVVSLLTSDAFLMRRSAMP